MLLGKRPRPPIMRRTRSMSGGMAIDTQTQQATTEATTNNLEVHEEVVMSDSLHDEDAINSKDPHAVVMGTHDDGFGHTKKNVIGDKGYEYDECLAGTVMFPSPTTTIANNHQTSNNNPAHAIHTTSHFLRTCGLCRCRLAPGRDIYMYRGDTAFCSLECREKQMKQDQRKEKRKAINKEEHRVISPPPTAKVSTKSETAAAACT